MGSDALYWPTSFVFGFFHRMFSQGMSSMWLILCRNSLPFVGWVTFHCFKRLFSIHPSVDTWIASTFWFLGVKQLQTLAYKYVVGLFSVLGDLYFKMELLGHKNSIFNILRHCQDLHCRNFVFFVFVCDRLISNLQCSQGLIALNFWSFCLCLPKVEITDVQRCKWLGFTFHREKGNTQAPVKWQAAVFCVLGAGFLVSARSHTHRHHLSVAWPGPFLEPFHPESNSNCQNFIYQAGAVFREKFTCTCSDDWSTIQPLWFGWGARPLETEVGGPKSRTASLRGAGTATTELHLLPTPVALIHTRIFLTHH